MLHLLHNNEDRSIILIPANEFDEQTLVLENNLSLSHSSQARMYGVRRGDTFFCENFAIASSSS